MLSKLTIRNFALIENLETDFDKGLNILTGETGSGKSIIMEALDLLLGARADSTLLKNKEEKCVIEGEFEIGEYGFKELFDQLEIDYSDSTILRREINPQGKSRAFINDSPVTLNQLKELGEALVDIHSQHETLAINKSINQLDMLDAFGDHRKMLEDYKRSFFSWRTLQQELNALKEKEAKAKLDHDYYLFQFNELSGADLKEGEDKEIEQELELLNNSEDIKLCLSKAAAVLGGDDTAVLSALKELKGILSRVSAFDKKLEELSSRVESSFIELQDIYAELEDLNDKVAYDPERIQLLNDRLNILNDLLFKHRVKEITDLINLRDDLDLKLQDTSSLNERISELEESVSVLFEELKEKGSKLTEARKKNAPKLEKEVNRLLGELSMPYAELFIQLTTSAQPMNNGWDEIRFLFKANKGSEPKELAKVASGGEFSRLMLSLKSILASRRSLPTIIFDEIDTGVSGEVAHKMGEIMKRMGRGMQVFSITHLPQVAGKGNAHYKVFKETDKKTTRTQIRKLSDQERLEEVARMLSGDKLSDAAMANARELLA